MGVHTSPEVYQEIKNLLGIEVSEDWREDEPIFILRAQDVLAHPTIEYYEDLAEARGCDPSFLDGLRLVRNAVQDWQVKNSSKVKRPD